MNDDVDLWPNEPTLWNGFDRHEFRMGGRRATVVVPREADAGRPWLWRGEFFGAFPSVDLALLERGWHVAYLDCQGTFGSPATTDAWTAFYAMLTEDHRLATRPVLMGMSRGGLYVYRWAALHPQRVGLIYGDAPVCDVKSWPGGYGSGVGSRYDWELFKQAHGLSQEAAMDWRGNPIDLLEPLARHCIPILHVVGDADDVVPVSENTAMLKGRYEKLGGRVEVIVKPGVGHHPHSLTDPTPIVDHILAHRIV
jgi:pimeloyl-ACP methyl ester carboxylesterase